MNGPQHYRVAEQYLTSIKTGDPVPNVTALAAAAQAHATLALAAATALAGLSQIDDNTREFSSYIDDETTVEWLRAMEAES